MDYTSFAPGASANPVIPPKLEQQDPQNPKHIHKFTGLIILMILVGVGVVGGLWWWNQIQVNQAEEIVPTFTPRMDFNSNPDISVWKTYTNTKYGLSFQYPADLLLSENPYGDRTESGIYLELTFLTQGSQTAKYTFLLSSATMSQMLLARKQYSVTDTVLGGHPAKKDIIPATKNGDFAKAEVFADLGAYRFLGYSNIGVDSNFDNILSTIKFTDAAGQFCGGIAGVMCPSGYSCKYEGDYPDAGGTCAKN